MRLETSFVAQIDDVQRLLPRLRRRGHDEKLGRLTVKDATHASRHRVRRTICRRRQLAVGVFAQRHRGNQPTIQHAGDDLVGNSALRRREDRSRAEYGGRQQRFGQQCPPGFLEYDGQHAQAEPEPATVLRDGQ